MTVRPKSATETLPRFIGMLRQLWPYIKNYKVTLALSFLALFAEIGFRLLEPWAIAIVIDHVLVDLPGAERNILPIIGRYDLTPMGLLYVAAGFLVVTVSLRAFCSYLSTIGFAIVGNRVLTEVRGRLYDHLQKLSLSYHGKARSGDLTVRVIGDIGKLQEVAVTAVMPLVANVFVLIGMMTVMFVLNWQLALISIVTLPLFALFSTRLSRSISSVSRDQRKREGAMAATASESIGAIKVVQALSLERVFSKSFSSENAKSMKEGVRAKRLAARLERSADVLIAISTALALFFGARLALTGGLSPGELVVFMTYLKSAFKPVRDFAKYTGRLARATASGERVMDILNEEPDVKDLPQARPAPAFAGRVEFEKVAFGYEPDQMVMSGMDLAVEPGRSVALVGPSGNGKSTIANLLLRLYDPNEGRVKIDGLDVRDYTLSSLRSQISVVMQDSPLFAASVRDNIVYGANHEPTDEEVVRAAKLAGADGFIEAMPDGYDTVLSERGSSLSGGQRQRISVARAAIREAPILLFDEPTTGLDERNERLVSDALERLSQDKTAFMITHDLDLASRADEILYVEDGRIAEHGSHDELLAADGRYAALYRLQSLSRELEEEIEEMEEENAPRR
ncbi:ABC transporter ATP-binding protein [Rubrobacter indicoceani]|uniref:ABC transporter ATP-binding protein n=1 Tax=Rubrobacter indicoceani TaxID=2051957 RepID=UPI000E5C3549|nr:ABC transporter ATP-binding protein [Rubrobacter indicoceani]